MWFFKPIIFFLLRLFFSKINVNNLFNDNNKPLLIIGNHFSWWDGFFGLFVAHKVLKRRLFVMMLEEQLIKRSYLSKIGAFSIKKNSKSALDSLNHASGLLEKPENAVLIFPQGRFQTQWMQQITFEKGWIRIANGTRGREKPQLVFMVCLVDYFPHLRPMLSIYISGFNSGNYNNNEEIEQAYNDFYHDCIKKQNLQT